MPSSSTRSTSLENLLLTLYKQIHTRLQAAGNLKPQAEFTTQQFALLLDMSEADILRTLDPITMYELHMIYINGGEKAKAKVDREMKFWEEMRRESDNKSIRRSERICAAGNGLADVGRVLLKVGRGAEAAKFCDWGDELWQMSIEAHEQEERKAARFYRGVVDVDMR